MKGGGWRVRASGRASAAAAIVAVLALTAAALVVPGAFRAHATTVPAGFVYAQGNQLFLDGQPYRFKGLNIFNANSRSDCWYSMQDPVLSSSLQDIGTGQNAFRAWFSQRMVYPTATSAPQWGAFDQTLADAAAANEKVIVTLGNQWGDCDLPSGYKDITWYQGKYTTDLEPYETYRAWVAEAVARYKDNPAVLFFQLMDEPEAGAGWLNAHTTSCDETAAAAALQSWARDMVSVVKPIDSNHLLDVGSIGGGQCGTTSDNYRALHAIPGIDLCEYHDYHDPDNSISGDQYNGLQLRINQCGPSGVNKPLFVGETGIARNEASTYTAGTTYPGDSGINADPCHESDEESGKAGCQPPDAQVCAAAEQLTCRSYDFQQKMNSQFAQGIVGELVWNWCYGPSGNCSASGYTVSENDPVLALLATYAATPPPTVPPTPTPTATPAPTPTATPPPTPTPVPPTCPAGWTCADIGNPTPAGTQAADTSVWTIQGGGSDIWGTSDQFRYVSQPFTGAALTARLLSQGNTSGWAKAGVMLRASADPGSPDYQVLLTPANGIVVQYRSAQGGNTVSAGSLTGGTVPVYLGVSVSGGTFSAYTSSDGTTWNPVSGSTVSPGFTPALGGIAVTSHNGQALSSVRVDSVTMSSTPLSPPGCPAGWSCADLGNPTPAGGQSMTGGTWTIQGGGSDIWGTSDQFRYVWQALSGAGSLTARISAQGNTSAWAKAGVMLRASTSPGSPGYQVLVTPGNGVVVQYRSVQGGNTSTLVSRSGTVPLYLGVGTSGSAVTAYTSSDGAAWSPIAGSTLSLNLGSAPLAGIAVTSHNYQALSSVSADSVSVSAAAAPGCPSGWSCADIGSPTPAGTQSLSGTTWTLQAGGSDIWSSSDHFHYVWRSLPGDGSVSARVSTESNSSVWAKAGLMVRTSTDPGAPNYAVLLTPSNGLSVQWRATQAGQTGFVNVKAAAPLYLQITRNGSTFTAFTSPDGVTWTPIPGSTQTLALSGTLLDGLAVTSHNSAALNTSTFDALSFS